MLQIIFNQYSSSQPLGCRNTMKPPASRQVNAVADVSFDFNGDDHSLENDVQKSVVFRFHGLDPYES